MSYILVLIVTWNVSITPVVPFYYTGPRDGTIFTNYSEFNVDVPPTELTEALCEKLLTAEIDRLNGLKGAETVVAAGISTSAVCKLYDDRAKAAIKSWSSLRPKQSRKSS